MKALVLGCGSIGRRHAGNLVTLGVEVFVHDVDDARASSVGRATGAGVVDRDRAPRVDLVVVATPTANHVDDLDWALAREAHVFVEKPLAHSWGHLRRAVTAAASAPSCHVMVGCNLRFTEGFRLFRDEVRAAGPLAVLLGDFGWWLPSWRPGSDYREQYSAVRDEGGGIVLDAIHEIDYAMELAGPVTSVSSSCARSGILELDVEDVAEISLRHANGVHTHIHLDYLRRRYSRSCTAITPAAELRWDFASGRVERTRCAGEMTEVLAGDLDSDRNDAYIAEMRHLVTALERGEAPVNGIAEAAAVTAVALRARGEEAA